MKENYESVQKGLNILLSSLADYICYEMSKAYKDGWWNEVLYKLNDQRDLPESGDYAELVGSLDLANCLRLIEREWRDLFENKLPMDCRTYAKELMGVRNIVSHIGQQDLDQPQAERSLDTMSLLCSKIDPEATEKIKELYLAVRAKSVYNPVKTAEFGGLDQPESESVRGALKSGSLLDLVGTDAVQKTQQTKKITFNSQSRLYPVYKVRLDLLYYNDRNDRISTWITKYEAENGTGSLEGLDYNILNGIIENFIVESNTEAMNRTQKNIAVAGQIEPGVILADGRIVDGNRRFTCLRRLQRSSSKPLYFETVIMDADIQADKKQIKLLELAIQHGEESKVAYDQIDFAIGTYRDIKVTNLLTEKEYSASTGEPVSKICERISVAEIISEFLDMIGFGGLYHIAREYQVYDVFLQMLPVLRQLEPFQQKQLKKITFVNIMMKSVGEQRAFIRDIKKIIGSGDYGTFFEEQISISDEVLKKYAEADVQNKEDADCFASGNSVYAAQLKNSFEAALQRMRSSQLKTKPIDDAAKCALTLLNIDIRTFDRIPQDDKELLKNKLDEIMQIAKLLKNKL